MTAFLIAIGIIILSSVTVFLYMRQPKFGKAPSGERLAMIRQYANYRNGQFRNQIATPLFAEGYNAWNVWRGMLFRKHPRRRPSDAIPSQKNDLHHLPVDEDVVVWLGHSSYFMQIGGMTFLIDPVLSSNASPIRGSVKAFAGTDVYGADDLPPIDYLLITHDHYDHLDYPTVIALKAKVGKVICGMGAGAHFERWGYPVENILEKNWNEKITLDSTKILFTEPVRHQSGRGFARNNTLWTSFVLQTPRITIFMGSDGGYGPHFAEIGKKYGAFDLAILENGQYNKAWHYIHCLPEETLQAARDLRARRVLPIHNSKFTLAPHPWDEPMRELARLGASQNIPLLTPLIGQVVYLGDTGQQFEKWWEKMN